MRERPSRAVHALLPQVELLWRTARVLKKVADSDADARSKSARLKAALGHAQKAVELAPSDARGHKWLGILLGVNMPDAVAEKIQTSFLVRRHFDSAAELDPADATTRHLIGLWCFEVAKLSWLERRAAAALFASPPEATYDEAYSHLAAAEKITPGFYAKNRLMLAQCCVAMGRKAEAKKWLAECLATTSADADDDAALREAAKMRV
jgi:tetratricopeptide (TPR) repeat protein